MASDATQNLKTAAADRSPIARRRRLPSAAEQARRVAWGREWGKVGAEHARKIRAEGK